MTVFTHHLPIVAFSSFAACVDTEVIHRTELTWILSHVWKWTRCENERQKFGSTLP